MDSSSDAGALSPSVLRRQRLDAAGTGDKQPCSLRGLTKESLESFEMLMDSIEKATQPDHAGLHAVEYGRDGQVAAAPSQAPSQAQSASVVDSAPCRKHRRISRSTGAKLPTGLLQASDRTRLAGACSNDGDSSVGASGRSYRSRAKTGKRSGSDDLSHLALQKKSRLLQVKRCVICPEVQDVVRNIQMLLGAASLGNAIFNRCPTKGAAIQVSRTPTVDIDRAIAAGVVSVGLDLALAAQLLNAELDDSCLLGNPMGFTTFNPAGLHAFDRPAAPSAAAGGSLVLVTSSSDRPYNAMPHRLGASGILAAASHLARMERDSGSIRSAIGHRHTNKILEELVRNILREGEDNRTVDRLWAAVILLSYCMSSPRGRRLLPLHCVTNLDLELTRGIEWYGSVEVTRRENLDRSQLRPAGARGSAIRTAPSDDHALIRGNSAGQPPVPFLEHWHRSLMSTDSAHAHVPYCLMSESNEAARAAGLRSMQKQAAAMECGEDILTTRVCEEHAERVCSAMRQYVDQGGGRFRVAVVVGELSLTEAQSGSMQIEGVASASQRRISVVGLERSRSERQHTRLLAAYVPTESADAAPHSSTGIATMWALWSLDLCRFQQAGDHTALPGIAETAALCQELRSKQGGESKSRAGSNSERARLALSRPLSRLDQQLSQTGLASGPRSLISVCRVVKRHPCDATAARGVADFVKAAVGRSARVRAGGSDRLVPAGVLEQDRTELCTEMEPPIDPCIGLAAALRTSQRAEALWRCKYRKDRPCAYAVVSVAGAPMQTEPVESYAPFPIVNIDDVSIAVVGADDGDPTLPVVAFSFRTRFARPTRLVEVVQHAARSADFGADRLLSLLQLVLVGASQAAYVSDIHANLSAGALNNSAARSQRITNADNTYIPMLGLAEVWYGECYDLAHTCPNTDWECCTGSHVHAGGSPPGLGAINNYASDNRVHARSCVDQRSADEFLREIQKRKEFVMPDGRKVTRPAETWGESHCLIPRVHKALDPYVDALERVNRWQRGGACGARVHAAVEAACGRPVQQEAIDSLPGAPQLAIFPWAPWSQNLRPHCLEGTHDEGGRTRRCAGRAAASTDKETSGRSCILDATPEDEALWSTASIDGVRPGMASPIGIAHEHDNPFAQSNEEIDVCMCVLSTLALGHAQLAHAAKYGSCDPGTADAYATASVGALYELLIAYHTDKEPRSGVPYFVAASAMVLLSAVYPARWVVGQPVIDCAHSKAFPVCYRKAQQQFVEDPSRAPTGLPLLQCIDRNLYDKALVGWAPFERSATPTRCVWRSGIAPMLLRLARDRGAHPRSMRDFAEMRLLLDGVVRAAWLRYSPDGLQRPASPCPCSQAASPQQMCRFDVEQDYVGSNGSPPVGALVGLKPCMLRQVLILQACASVEGIDECQVYGIGGQLYHRLSSAADISERRSIKAISPTQTDRDLARFGTAEQRRISCQACRAGWESNFRLRMPLYFDLSTPASHEVRTRGSRAMAARLRSELDAVLRPTAADNGSNPSMAERAPQPTCAESALAKDAFMAAAASPHNTASSAVLRHLHREMAAAAAAASTEQGAHCCGSHD